MNKELDILKILLSHRKLKAHVKKLPGYKHDCTIKIFIKKIIEIDSDHKSKLELKRNMRKSIRKKVMIQWNEL